MIATQIPVTPTAAVIWQNPGVSPVTLRLVNSTATPTVVRLSGTPTGLKASSGYPWAPGAPTGPLQLTVPPYDSVAACANPTQVLDILGWNGSPRARRAWMPPLQELLAPHLHPVRPTAGQTLEQALNAEAESLAVLARTFLDWDGPGDVADIEQQLGNGLDVLARPGCSLQANAEAPLGRLSRYPRSRWRS
jgi:hypothetical protein